MHLVKWAAFLVVAAFTISGALAQDEVIARAYRTVNVRSGPGTEYEIVGQLSSGSEASINGRSDDESDWLRIGFRGVEGWVAYFTVTILGETTDLPVVSPRLTLDNPIVRPAPTPTVIPVAASGDVFVTTYRRVNVRRGPGTEYTVFGSLDTGHSADVIGRTTDDEWLRIDFEGEEGWVAYFVVSLSGSLKNAEEIATFAEPVEVMTKYNVNLHQSPGLDSPIVEIVPFGTPLTAGERSDANGTWLAVTYGGRDGWLLSRLVSVNAGDPVNLSIETP